MSKFDHTVGKNNMSKSLKIGIDARLTYYRTGGISTYIIRLIQNLHKLDQHNQYRIIESRKIQNSVSNGFPNAKVWTPSHHRIEKYALSVELMRFGFDVFHTTDFIPPLRGGKRHVVSIHDLSFLHYPEFLTEESRRYYNDQIQYAVRHADHILTISEHSKRDLVSLLGVPPEKITVQLLAADEKFHPLRNDLVVQVRKQLELPEQYLLFVGTLEPRKNILGLVEAYVQLTRQMSNAPSLVIAGKAGWNFEETQEKINAFQLGNRLIWRENISQEQLPAVYNGASLLVIPSFYEGFGLTALEAMACGTIPIVSNRSSLPEVVGDVGLQINPDDPTEIAQAFEYALTHPEWQIEQQQLALQRAQHFNWEDTARIALETYKALA